MTRPYPGMGRYVFVWKRNVLPPLSSAEVGFTDGNNISCELAIRDFDSLQWAKGLPVELHGFSFGIDEDVDVSLHIGSTWDGKQFQHLPLDGL